jgi:hypothetical protein
MTIAIFIRRLYLTSSFTAIPDREGPGASEAIQLHWQHIDITRGVWR